MTCEIITLSFTIKLFPSDNNYYGSRTQQDTAYLVNLLCMHIFHND